MPLTSKGKKIKATMTSEYGAKKGTSVFYASINKGKIHGAEAGGKVRSGEVKRSTLNDPNARHRTPGMASAVAESTGTHPMLNAKSNAKGRW